MPNPEDAIAHGKEAQVRLPANRVGRRAPQAVGDHDGRSAGDRSQATMEDE